MILLLHYYYDQIVLLLLRKDGLVFDGLTCGFWVYDLFFGKGNEFLVRFLTEIKRFLPEWESTWCSLFML